MDNQFGFFECEHPNKFLKISGTKKIGSNKVLITNVKKPQFSREEQAQRIRRENEEYQRQYLQRHPWLVERHECPYVNFETIDVAPADPVNDLFDRTEEQTLHTVAFSDIPRTHFEPTEFRVVQSKKKRAALPLFGVSRNAK